MMVHGTRRVHGPKGVRLGDRTQKHCRASVYGVPCRTLVRV